MAELTKEEEESNKVKEDWKFVAMVLDRSLSSRSWISSFFLLHKSISIPFQTFLVDFFHRCGGWDCWDNIAGEITRNGNLFKCRTGK